MYRTAFVLSVVTAAFATAIGYGFVVLPRVEAGIWATLLGVAYGASFARNYRTIRRWFR